MCTAAAEALRGSRPSTTSTDLRARPSARAPLRPAALPPTTSTVPLDALVGAPSDADPRVHSQPVQRNGMTMWPLTRRPGRVQAYRALIPPHTRDGDREQRLLLGEHDLLLSPGEVVEFDTHVPHWFGNTGKVPVEVLILFGPQGERMHVRARARAR